MDRIYESMHILSFETIKTAIQNCITNEYYSVGIMIPYAHQGKEYLQTITTILADNFSNCMSYECINNYSYMAVRFANGSYINIVSQSSNSYRGHKFNYMLVRKDVDGIAVRDFSYHFFPYNY